MNLIEKLLLDVFKAQGAADPAGLAKRAAAEFERDQRDKKIYELRASLTTLEISTRMGISERRVEQIVSEQHRRRKVA